MRSRLVTAALLGICSALGATSCDRTPRDRVRPDDVPTKKAPKEPPHGVAVREGEAVERFEHGRVVAMKGLLAFELTQRPVACGEDVTNLRRLAFTVPPGPKKKYFAGSVLGVPSISLPDDRARLSLYAGPSASELTLAPFELAVGARVRGRLRFAGVAIQRYDGGMPTRTKTTGEGDFDLEICELPDASELPELPADAPSAPIAGTIESEAFLPKSVFARRAADGDGHPYLELSFHADEAKCVDGRVVTTSPDVIEVDQIGGASVPPPLLGHPLPAAISVIFSYYELHSQTTAAWVRLREVDRTHVSGDLAARTSGYPRVVFEGRFDATICDARDAK